jgi:predicted NAD/FAD-binding protein
MERLIADLGDRAKADQGIAQLHRMADGMELVFCDGHREIFDEVVLACHSDQALRMLAQPSVAETEVLGAIPYQVNRVILHRDASLMPRQRRVWSSWNYLSEPQTDAGSAVSVTYWMNSLQRLPTHNDYFVSLNPLSEPAAETTVAEFSYEHPIFGLQALDAQRQLHRIQGKDGVWFAGAWTGYGFHEDGMRSGVEVARALGARIPWEQQVDASRGLNPFASLVPEAA